MVLDERNTHGLHVRIDFLPLTDMVVLNVQRGDVMRAVVVDPANARDALDHPMTYVPDPDSFFPKVSS